MREVAPKPSKKMPKTKKTRVCLDLDGVLAEYNGWEGSDHIGPPLPGALKFAIVCRQSRGCCRVYKPVLYRNRRSSIRFRGLTAGQLRIKVVDWLERNGFPFADV